MKKLMVILASLLIGVLIAIAAVNVAKQKDPILDRCLKNYALASEIMVRQHKIIVAYETMLEKYFPLPKKSWFTITTQVPDSWYNLSLAPGRERRAWAQLKRLISRNEVNHAGTSYLWTTEHSRLYWMVIIYR